MAPNVSKWPLQRSGSPPWHLILLPVTRLVTMPQRCYFLIVSGICPLTSNLCSLLPYIIYPRSWTGFVCSLASSSLASKLPPAWSFKMSIWACHLKLLDGFSLPSTWSPSLYSLAHRSSTTCCSHTSRSSPQAPRVPTVAKGSWFPESKLPLFTPLLGSLPCPRPRLLLSEASHEAPGRDDPSLQTSTAALVTLKGK